MVINESIFSHTRYVQKPLQDYFKQFRTELEFFHKLSPESLRGYTAAFTLFLMLMPEINCIEHLNTEMLCEFFRRLQTRKRLVGRNIIKEGVKNSTVTTYWSKLNTFFAWLIQKELLHSNPLAKIKHPKPIYEDSRALSENEIRKLYAAVSLHSKSQLLLRRDTLMLSLLYFTGLRFGEFISLEISDFDIEKQLLTVRGNTSKSKRVRFIPIHPTLLFHLKDYVSERNKKRYTTPFLLVSRNRDRNLSREGLRHWVKSLCQKSGVKFHLHQLRHSFACNLASKDVNAVKIQRLLGHGSLDMTMTYLRSIKAEDLKAEINRLGI